MFKVTYGYDNVCHKCEGPSNVKNECTWLLHFQIVRSLNKEELMYTENYTLCWKCAENILMVISNVSS